MLRQNGVHKPDLHLIFASHITDPTGGDMAHSAETHPDGKTIVFAVNTGDMQEMVETLGPAPTILLYSAHEAMHVVQIKRGDPPPLSERLSPEERVNEPHEIEAWKEALQLFKGVRPTAAGNIYFEGRKYKIPKKVNI